MKLELSRYIFQKCSHTKLHDDVSSGSRVVQCGQTDQMMLTVAFLNFANAHKKMEHCKHMGIKTATEVQLNCDGNRLMSEIT